MNAWIVWLCFVGLVCLQTKAAQGCESKGMKLAAVWVGMAGGFYAILVAIGLMAMEMPQ